MFILFPLWSSWIINAYLPSNIVLKDFESDYPGINQIFVQKLLLDINGTKISVTDLNLKYDLSDIQLDELTIKLHDEKKPEATNDSLAFKLDSLKLPKIEFQSFDFLEKLQVVKVTKISVLNQLNTYHFSELNFNNENKLKSSLEQLKKLQLTLKLPSIVSNQPKPLDLRFFLTLDSHNKQVDIKIKQNEDNIAKLSYSTPANQTRLNLEANLDRFQSLFAEFFVGIPVQMKNNITINWRQDDKKNTSEIELETILLIPEKVSKLSESLVVPINVSITSDLKEELNGKIKLKAHTTVPFELNSAQTKLSFKPLNINLETQFSQIDKSKDDIIIQIASSKINLFSNKLDLQFDGSELSFEQYNLNTVIRDLAVNLNELDQAGWQISNVFLSENVTGYYKNDTKIDSKIIFDTKLTKSEHWIGRGNILLSELQITDPLFSLNGILSIDLQDVSADLGEGKISINFDTSDNRVAGLDFDSLNINTELFLQNEFVEGEGNVLLNKQNLMPFSMEFNKKTSALVIDLKENLLANPIFNHFLNIIGKHNKLPLRILEGETIHSGNITLKENLFVASQLEIKDMLFQFGKNEIRGLNLFQELTSFDPLQFKNDITIDKINFSSGLAIDNLSATINGYSKDNILVENIKGELFEGLLVANKLSFGSNGLKESTIKLKEISLTELVFFMDVEGLYAEGQLDLSLPLTMKEASPVIKNGTFKATKEGIIKYSTGEIDPQADTNIALQALQNFHYQSLDGAISYDQAGKYHIKLHLLGSNPDLYDGYPVDFVLHLRGELTGMFRSMFLTGNFDDAVMQQVKTDQLKQDKTNSTLENK